MVELKIQNFQKNKQMFENVKLQLENVLGKDVIISHVGSTAIPNMVGKNIIDVLVGVENDDQFQEVLQKLNKLGFYASQNSKSEIYQFFASKETETGDGDTHIHLVIINTDRYREFLWLRDYLLEHEQEAKNYSNFKQQLINKGITDRKQYRATKSEYVSALIERAKSWYNNR